MPDLKDANHELADALTEAGAMPQWELVVTAQFLNQPTTMRLRVDGGHLYVHGNAMTFAPMADGETVADLREEIARLTHEMQAGAAEWSKTLMMGGSIATELDAAREQLHRLEEENGRLRGQTELLQGERDRAQQGYEREHSMRHQSNQALVQVAQEREACTAKLARVEGELLREQLGREQAERRCEELRGERETWQRKYAEQRRQAEDWEAEACKARQERDAARAAADEWSAIARDVSNSAAAATAHPSHVGQRPTQVGQASFVMRGCRLPEGHEGPCSIR